MARSSFCITSILLLFFVILASASDYVYNQKPEEKEELPTSESYYKEQVPKEKIPYEYEEPSKSEGKEKLIDVKLLHEKPKPQENEKLVYDKPNYEKPTTDFFYNKPDYEQSKPEEKEKLIPSELDYEKLISEGKEKLTPINYPKYEQPKVEEKEKFLPTKTNYGNYEQPRSSYNKPNYEQPKPEEKEKLIPSELAYEKLIAEGKEKPIPIKYPELYKQPKPDQEKEKYLPTKSVYAETKSEEKEKIYPTKPNYEKKNYEVPTSIAVQGLIYCKSGSKISSIPGAVAKVICLAIDEKSYETTQITVLSQPCDSKGYFYATVEHAWKIKECKVYLNYSPLDTCNVPTNDNNGISGYSLSSNYKILRYGNVKLFSVAPFFYTAPVQSYNKPVANANNGY